MKTRKIEVTYDGRFPNACSGRLIIKVDDDQVYSDEHKCSVQGGGAGWCDGEEFCYSGELTWDDAGKFPRDVQICVEAVLGSVTVCCGGCI